MADSCQRSLPASLPPTVHLIYPFILENSKQALHTQENNFCEPAVSPAKGEIEMPCVNKTVASSKMEGESHDFYRGEGGRASILTNFGKNKNIKQDPLPPVLVLRFWYRVMRSYMLGFCLAEQ